MELKAFEKLVEHMKEIGSRFDPDSVEDLKAALEASLLSGFAMTAKANVAIKVIESLMVPARFGVEAAQKMRAESFGPDMPKEAAERLEAAHGLLAREWTGTLESAERLLELLSSGGPEASVGDAREPQEPAAETPAEAPATEAAPETEAPATEEADHV